MPDSTATAINNLGAAKALIQSGYREDLYELMNVFYAQVERALYGDQVPKLSGLVGTARLRKFMLTFLSETPPEVVTKRLDIVIRRTHEFNLENMRQTENAGDFIVELDLGELIQKMNVYFLQSTPTNPKQRTLH